MSKRIDQRVISNVFDYITIKQTETILMQMKKSICMVKVKLTGTGFFCFINYEN